MKLKTLLLAAALVAISQYTFAQQNVQVQTARYTITSREVANFDGIKIQGPFDVYISQGTEESVKLDAPTEILDRIVIEVKDGVLSIQNKHDNWGWGYNSWWSDKSWWHKHHHVAVYITVNNPSSLSMSGSGGMYFTSGITANSLRISLSGSGKMEGKLDVKTLDGNMSGSGHIKLSGKAENSALSMSGSGHFEARELVTFSTSVHVSGSGHADINASEKVDARVNGSASISYSGDAKIINSSKSGSGRIGRR